MVGLVPRSSKIKFMIQEFTRRGYGGLARLRRDLTLNPIRDFNA
jgi:hypothetical protein